MHDNLNSKLHDHSYIAAQAVHNARGREFGRGTSKGLGDWLFILVLCAPGLAILGLILWGLWRNVFMG